MGPDAEDEDAFQESVMELEVVPRTLSCGGAGGTPLFLLTGVEDDGLKNEIGKGEREAEYKVLKFLHKM